MTVRLFNMLEYFVVYMHCGPEGGRISVEIGRVGILPEIFKVKCL